MRAFLAAGFVILSLVGIPALAGVSDQGGDATPPAIIPVDEAQVRALVSESSGKVILLNVWATWCAPCIEEFPDLLKLRSAYVTSGLEVKFLSIDHPRKDIRAVQTFLRKMHVDFPTYIKTATNDESFINALHPDWSGAVPATFVYDRTGRLVQTRIDSQTYEELVALIKPLL